ncbi:secretory calcium-binding phosphoprotein 7 [Amia ocellicauda]|uniref:secretory calcium-binding phosphoprotein 7 n=1 Tax=Amia ocellicauda TaxID=2972642 RepID=UPI0034648EE0
MKEIILFTCFLGLTLQAPTPQEQTAGPPSIEILLPYGFQGQAFGTPQHAAHILQQNGLPAHASIEFLVPYGGPHHQSGLPSQMGQMFPNQGYIKQKKLQAPGAASNEHNNPDPAAEQTPQQDPAGPASIEILMPYGFTGQQFGIPNTQNPSQQMPQHPGHVSIEMLYPYAFPGQAYGYPQQHGMQNDAPAPPAAAAAAAAAAPPMAPGAVGHASVEIIPSQGFLKRKIPQPAGARSLEVLYPFSYRPENPMFPFANTAPATPEQLNSQSPNVRKQSSHLRQEVPPPAELFPKQHHQVIPTVIPGDRMQQEPEQAVLPSAKTPVEQED